MLVYQIVPVPAEAPAMLWQDIRRMPADDFGDFGLEATKVRRTSEASSRHRGGNRSTVVILETFNRNDLRKLLNLVPHEQVSPESSSLGKAHDSLGKTNEC